VLRAERPEKAGRQQRPKAQCGLFAARQSFGSHWQPTVVLLLSTWQVPVNGQVVHTPNSLISQVPVGEVRRARMWQHEG
jgi:hypothetical protein